MISSNFAKRLRKSSKASAVNAPSITESTNITSTDVDFPPPPASFDQLLATTELPPPGPSHYIARREIWLTHRALPRGRAEPSTSRQRLEDLLNRPGAVANEGVWKSGVEKVWKGLSAGGRLKRPLPMNLIVSIQLCFTDPKLIISLHLSSRSSTPLGCVTQKHGLQTVSRQSQTTC